MQRGLAALAFVGVAASVAASCVSLALFGLGLPFLLAALIAAAAAGAMIYTVGRWGLSWQRAADPESDRLQRLEVSSATLRHELRGVLSPALMVSDRLLNNEDPAIQRAGQAVVRSVERATELIVRNKVDGQPDPPRPRDTEAAG